MKKLYTILAAIVITATTFAQTPEKMTYQAVVRNSSDLLISNQSVGMQISILQTSPMGTAVYVETHTPTTNINGLVTFEIGTGNVVSGNFSTIDWSADSYFIKTETDPTGGAMYTITGTSQLLSVPYALHAKTAESVSGINGTPAFLPKFTSTNIIGDSQIIDNGTNIGIGTTSPNFILDIEGTGGPRARIYSSDGFFAGLLTQNATRQFFIGTQGVFEAADGTNSGFHIYDNTAGARRMVIDASGNMGIGNSAPTARLDIAGTIKIVDGTQGQDKVLTSDANGLASWQTPVGGSSLMWQGIWVSQEYFIDDVVEFNGSSYVCVLNTTTNQDPTDTDYWDLLAAKGGVYNGATSTSISISSFGDCSFQFPGCASGNVTIVTDTVLEYTPGMRIRISETSDPLNNFVEGIVTAYDGTNMDVAVDWSAGTATFSSWNINLGSGKPGVPGPIGNQGPGGFYSGGSITAVATTSYQAVASFIYDGNNNFQGIQNTYVRASCNAGATYDIRLYDFDNNTVLAELIGLSNTSPTIHDLGFTNSPFNLTAIEIQVRRTSGTGNVTFYSALVE